MHVVRQTTCNQLMKDYPQTHWKPKETLQCGFPADSWIFLNIYFKTLKKMISLNLRENEKKKINSKLTSFSLTFFT